jgi:hypothetical protein
MIKTLNVVDLKEEIQELKQRKLREMTPSGSYVTLYLLFS